MKLKPEVKAAWLAALRSGEYKQAQGRLTLVTRNEDGTTTTAHCCLGVLCEILPEVKATRRITPEGETYYGADGRTSVLPAEAIAAAYEPSDFLIGAASVYINESRLSLAYLNDRLGFDFAKIADAIEASL